MIGTETRRRAEAAPRVEEAELLAAVPPGGSLRDDVRMGTFVLLGLVAVVVALFLLTDPSFFRGRYEVTTTVPNAGGLRTGDPVQMRGVNIGRIRGFDIRQDGVRITLELERKYDVPADSRVVLHSAGLLGGMVADVLPGPSAREVDAGASLAGTTDAGAAALSDAALGVSIRADTLLQRAQALLAPATIGAVGTSATELQATLTQLAGLVREQRREIGVLVETLQRSAANTEKATGSVAQAVGGPELERSLARVDSLTARLNQTSAQLNQASGSLQAVLARVDRGEGTLGKLSRDDSLYVNLNQAAANVNALVADIQANPKRYINLRVF